MAKGLSKKGLTWIIVAVSFIVLSTAGGLLLRRWLIELPTVQQQIQAANQAVVTISRPGNHSRWPLDAFIPVQVHVDSAQPLQRVELYAGENLVGQQDLTQLPTLLLFHWQPEKTGKTVLSARLIIENGQAYTSQPVTVTITNPVGALAWVETRGSETLSGLSDRYQVEQARIRSTNPSIDFSGPLPEGLQIQIPIQNQIGAAAPQTAPEPASLPEIAVITEPETIWSKIQFQIQLLFPNDASVPNAPELQVQAVGCDAQLTILDQSDNEDGFFVLRTLPGQPNAENIASLSANETQLSLGFVDAQQTGTVVYTVSAYNSTAENISAPASVSFPVDCLVDGMQAGSGLYFDYQVSVVDGGLSLEDHVIQFQQPVDLAYLYISVNEREWERIPAGNQKFLSGDGDKFDLDIYLGQIINKYPETELEIDMEIWGWSGKNLIDHGTLHISLRRTVLRVCGIASVECGADLLRTEINLPSHIDPATLFYQFQWETAAMDEKIDYVWQVAAKPFTGDAIRSTESLIISRGVYNTSDQNFKFNLSYLFQDGPFNRGSWPSMGQNFDSNFFDDFYPKETSFTLYVRVLPFDEDNNQLPVSNTVILHYTTEWEDLSDPVYASNLPSRYQVEFLPESYHAPVLVQDHRWGCIVFETDVYQSHPFILGLYGIREQDFDADPENCNNTISATCNGKEKPLLYPAGMVCPANYSEPDGFWNDVKTLSSGIWNGVTGGWDYLANGFESVKQALAEEIASVIPGCEEECTGWVKKGLEIAFTAITGIPANLPSYEELMDEGIEYAAELVAQEIGPACEEICKEAIRYGLENVVQEIEFSKPAPGCANETEAHARGKEPFCPDLAGVPWYPAAGASYEPALIQVRVSRPPASGPIPQMAITQETHDQYRIGITSYGYNDTRMGDWFPLCGFQEGLDGSNAMGHNSVGTGFHNKRQIDQALESALYTPQALTLPRLLPGESQVIPLVFDAQLFWRMYHLYDVGQFGANYEDFINQCGDDWPYLYYDGFSRLTAVEECMNDQNQWVPCSGGGSDIFETFNPSAP